MSTTKNDPSDTTTAQTLALRWDQRLPSERLPVVGAEPPPALLPDGQENPAYRAAVEQAFGGLTPAMPADFGGGPASVFDETMAAQALADWRSWRLADNQGARTTWTTSPPLSRFDTHGRNLTLPIATSPAVDALRDDLPYGIPLFITGRRWEEAGYCTVTMHDDGGQAHEFKLRGTDAELPLAGWTMLVRVPPLTGDVWPSGFVMPVATLSGLLDLVTTQLHVIVGQRPQPVIGAPPWPAMRCVRSERRGVRLEQVEADTVPDARPRSLVEHVEALLAVVANERVVPLDGRLLARDELIAQVPHLLAEIRRLQSALDAKEP